MKTKLYKLLIGLLISLQGFSQADPDINIQMIPATMEVGQNGYVLVSTCNNGNIDIVANSLRITVSVGINGEITGLDPTSDPRWTVLSSTTGTNNTFQLKNTGGTMTSILGANPCANIKLNVVGTMIAGPSNITGTIGYISGNNPLLGGAPNSSQGNSSTANDNSTTSLLILIPTCVGNQLFTDPPANTSYFGGFESGSNNFGLWINSPSNSKYIARTGLTAAQYSIVNTPDLANPFYTNYPPLGGDFQMIAKTVAAGDTIWSKLDTTNFDIANNKPRFFRAGPQFPFSAYFSKVNTGTDPQIKMIIYDTEDPAKVFATATVTVSGLPGQWTKMQITPIFLPVNPLGGAISFTKKARYSIISLNGAPFSMDMLCSASPLTNIVPITLLSFTAVKQYSSVDLNWQTATESNSSKFVVETSTNAVTWTAIGTVAAAGNSNTQRDYSLVHLKPVNGVNYYRLKLVDLDASFKYSEVRSVSFSTLSTDETKVLPNPVKDRLYITNNRNTIFESVIVYSSEGKLMQQVRNLRSGGSIDMSGYAAGVYMVKITDENGNTVNRSVVKK